MRQRMMIGKYIDTNSWVHRLDPRAKASAMLLFMWIVLMINTYTDVLIVLAFSLAIMLSTTIPLHYYARAVKPLLVIVLFIFLFQLLFNASGAPLLTVGSFHIYAGGLEKGVFAATRMTLFIALTALLTFTTKPEHLTHALGYMLTPLKWIGLSPSRLSLMIGIAFRFIPTVFEQADTIWKAQVSRGLTLKGKKLKEQARLLLALLVPITVGAFRRAIELAESMEARGYRLHRKRTAYVTFRWGFDDIFFIGLFIAMIFIMIFAL